MSDKKETIEVVIIPLREFFYSDDSNWGTYKIESEDIIPNFKLNKNMSGVNVYEGGMSGNMQRLEMGSPYRVVGTVNYHNKYGWQIAPITVLPNVPKTLKQQQQFLESILTPKQSCTLLEIYPNIVQDVIDEKDDIDFNLLKGITENNFKDIRIKICDNFIIADILALLSPIGVTYAMIKKLVNYENNPILLKQKLIENPYMLTDVRGLGFKKVDDLALKLNSDFENSKFRAIAYIKFRLKEVGDDEGHVWLNIKTLKSNFVDNVPQCEQFFDIIIQEQKENSTFLHVDNNTVGLKSRYEIEKNIYNKLIDIATTKSPYEITDENITNGIAIANGQQGFEYDSEQQDIIKEAVRSKVTVISGNGGVGKSCLARGILNVFKQANMNISCCALSAKASKIINYSTGFSALTMHKLFNIGVKDNNPEEAKDNFIQTDVLLIDEVSMINSYLFNYAVSHIKDNTIVIIIGDDKQLPPIGYGSVLRDLLINANNIKKLNTSMFIKHLEKIYRQANKSGIIHDANIIRENKKPFGNMLNKMITGELKDMFYMFINDKEKLHKEAINKYMGAIEKNGLENVAMITPINENGINASDAFNIEIQELLLPNENSIVFGKYTYKQGAKVMQIVNDYDKGVMNGEDGFIKEVNNNNCIIDFGEDRLVKYTKAELKNIKLAYCISCHKMQGSACNTIICVMDNSSYKLLDSCLLYTSLTRAKQRCMLISTPFAFEQCIRTNKQIDRQTYLNNMFSKK